MPNVTDPRTRRARAPLNAALFVKVTSTAKAVQAGYGLTRDGSPQPVAKLGHALAWNRTNSFPLGVADSYWSRVDLVFSAPAAESATVEQWIEQPPGTVIRQWKEDFKHSSSAYGWMEWRITVA